MALSPALRRICGAIGRALMENRAARLPIDLVTAFVILLASPALMLLARRRRSLPIAVDATDRIGVSIVQHHYYEPAFAPDSLAHPLDQPRALPGLRLDPLLQGALIGRLEYREELLAIPLMPPREGEFGHDNKLFGYGDAEIFYSFIRYFRPRRLIEIGSGHSTLIARRAIAANRRHDPGYACEHLCIEPYEVPWLERTGATVLRRRVEECELSLFEALEENDMLFVDSSHVIRPQGDVLHEVTRLYPMLAPGVLVHVHDIFTPHDYPAQWLIQERKLWNEQYLLEAFLAFNDRYDVICALNWLWRTQPDLIREACPRQAEGPAYQPSSFWFRRRTEAAKVNGGRDHEHSELQDQRRYG